MGLSPGNPGQASCRLIIFFPLGTLRFTLAENHPINFVYILILQIHEFILDQFTYIHTSKHLSTILYFFTIIYLDIHSDIEFLPQDSFKFPLHNNELMILDLHQEPFMHFTRWISCVSVIVQTALYADFFYYYFISRKIMPSFNCQHEAKKIYDEQF